MTELEKRCRRVKSNLLQQDIYVRDVILPKDVRTTYGAEQYYELQRKPLEHGIGIQEVLTPVDYPITPESVKSHAASCDYKVDPAGAIVHGQGRKNLGDVTGMQELLRLDSSAALELYQNLQKVFSPLLEAKKDSVPQEPSNGGNE